MKTAKNLSTTLALIAGVCLIGCAVCSFAG
jgi:hypothetical protein